MSEQKATTTIKEAMDLTGEAMLKFFSYEHLPPALQVVSRPFGDLAIHLCHTLERSPERTVALRKLLESKDAAVRASLPA